MREDEDVGGGGRRGDGGRGLMSRRDQELFSDWLIAAGWDPIGALSLKARRREEGKRARGLAVRDFMLVCLSAHSLSSVSHRYTGESCDAHGAVVLAYGG